MDAVLKQGAERYGLDPSRAKILKFSTNLVYDIEGRILSFTPRQDKSRIALRIENEWIRYLGKGGLNVATVIDSADGRLVEWVDDYWITCYQKIDGKKITPSEWDQSFYEKLGSYTGKLHRMGQQFEYEFNYPLLDWSEVAKVQVRDLLATDFQDFREVYDVTVGRIRNFIRSDSNFGLIHYDIHHENYLLVGDAQEICLFDFEMMCNSWYSNEIAVILYYILNSYDYKDHDEIQNVFLQHFVVGYRTQRILRDEELEHIPTFLLYRDLIVLGYLNKIQISQGLSSGLTNLRKRVVLSIGRRWKKGI